MADDQVQQVESTMAESVPAEQPIGPQSTTASEDVNMPEINVAEPDDDPKSQKVTLADLSAKGNALFAQRKYEEASEILSEASNLQAELNGETASNNAEILFLYGRCLFKVGQSKSNVLGGAAAAPAPKKSGAANGKGTKQKKVVETSTEEVNEEGGAGDAEQTGEAKVAAEGVDAKKPLFQFTGDENFDESDEDEVRLQSLFETTMIQKLTRSYRMLKMQMARSKKRTRMSYLLLSRFSILPVFATRNSSTKPAKKIQQAQTKAKRQETARTTHQPFVTSKNASPIPTTPSRKSLSRTKSIPTPSKTGGHLCSTS